MTATTTNTTTATSSEIDDIFSHKQTQLSRSNLKQKKRKNKRSQTDPKRPTPEIVLDPSIKLSHSHASTSKTVSHDRSVRSMPPSKKRRLVEKDKFKDSRGTAPRRKTEEGFAIYKENELGIDAEAGGTPLCPFDCSCCF